MNHVSIRRSAIAALLAAAGGFAMTCSVRARHQSYAPAPVMPLRPARRALAGGPPAGKASIWTSEWIKTAASQPHRT